MSQARTKADGLTEVNISANILSLPATHHSPTVAAPSDIPFSDVYPKPVPMSEEEILRVENAFVEAAERCKQIGCM